MVCPSCNGKGKTQPLPPGGGFGFNPGNRMLPPQPCSRCKGTGKVPDKR